MIKGCEGKGPMLVAKSFRWNLAAATVLICVGPNLTVLSNRRYARAVDISLHVGGLLE
jgi:hypothetical protein